nr:MAG TPA: hypothetical protein [Caudoviricetes sp.]DAO43068.1 MAG TPA: hypothetical protein [Caudoviricetes sp.]
MSHTFSKYDYGIKYLIKEKLTLLLKNSRAYTF